MENITIREIQPTDNHLLAVIIRCALTEFGANKPGTVYYDETTDYLFELFQQVGSVYYVAEIDNIVVGGAGIFPTAGLPEGTCELVKMYLTPTVRGIGLGRELIEKCLNFAKDYGYEQVYIETMPELGKAVDMYKKAGFKSLEGPIGDSGHYGCDVWLLKKL